MNGDSIAELKTKYELSKFKMKKEVTYMYGAGKDAKLDKKATFKSTATLHTTAGRGILCRCNHA